MIAQPGAPRCAREKRTDRLFFMDYLRAGLVTLVVLHHLAVVYAGNTGFYYLEPAIHGEPSLRPEVVHQFDSEAAGRCSEGGNCLG